VVNLSARLGDIGRARTDRAAIACQSINRGGETVDMQPDEVRVNLLPYALCMKAVPISPNNRLIWSRLPIPFTRSPRI
jgi:hypothetical protein